MYARERPREGKATESRGSTSPARCCLRLGSGTLGMLVRQKHVVASAANMIASSPPNVALVVARERSAAVWDFADATQVGWGKPGERNPGFLFDGQSPCTAHKVNLTLMFRIL